MGVWNPRVMETQRRRNPWKKKILKRRHLTWNLLPWGVRRGRCSIGSESHEFICDLWRTLLPMWRHLQVRQSVNEQLHSTYSHILKFANFGNCEGSKLHLLGNPPRNAVANTCTPRGNQHEVMKLHFSWFDRNSSNLIKCYDAKQILSPLTTDNLLPPCTEC